MENQEIESKPPTSELPSTEGLAAVSGSVPMCKVCLTEMKLGKAIPMATVHDGPIIHEGARWVKVAPLIRCWKCPFCGHSFTQSWGRADIFGWFDEKNQTSPAHDPGMKAPCVVCAKTLEAPVVTISLMPEDPKHRDRSYFFRAHKECWTTTPDHEKTLIESSLIDAICSQNA